MSIVEATLFAIVGSGLPQEATIRARVVVQHLRRTMDGLKPHTAQTTRSKWAA